MQAQRQHRQLLGDYADELSSRKAMLPVLEGRLEAKQAEIAKVERAAKPAYEALVKACRDLPEALAAFNFALAKIDAAVVTLDQAGARRLSDRPGLGWRVQGLPDPAIKPITVEEDLNVLKYRIPLPDSFGSNANANV